MEPNVLTFSPQYDEITVEELFILLRHIQIQKKHSWLTHCARSCECAFTSKTRTKYLQRNCMC